MSLFLFKRNQCRGISTFIVYIYIYLVFLFVSLCVFSPTFAAEVVVEPPMPLLNVAFQVNVKDLQNGQVLFLSRSSVCDLGEVLGEMCTISEKQKCVFNVTAASLNVNLQYTMVVPQVYICSTAFPNRNIDLLQLHVIAATSRFVFKGVSQFVTFNEATPVGSVIGFFMDDSCSIELSGVSPATLGADRKVGLIVPDSGILFVCARIPLKSHTKLDTLTPYFAASTLLVVPRFSLLNTEVIRHTKKVFFLTNMDRLVFASFSRFKTCDPLLQEPVKGQIFNQIELPILVPKGEYYLCLGLEYYQDNRLYVPSDKLVVVHEYGVQPHTMYAGLSTTMALTLDAKSLKSGEVMSVALFMTPDCNGRVVIDWNTVGNWVVRTPGLYYACVKGSNLKISEPALAANISVLNAPLLVLPPFVITGFDFKVEVGNIMMSKDLNVTVGLFLTPDCAGLISFQQLQESSNTVTLNVPWGVFDRLSLCVSTPRLTKVLKTDEELDRGYTYSFGTITVKPYNISYPPLFAGEKVSITLDQYVTLEEGTRGIFSKSSSNCSNIVGTPFLMRKGSVIKDIIFPEAGIYFMCIKHPKSPSYVRIAEVFVYGLVELSPTSIIPDTPTDVSVSLVPPEAPVRIVNSENCLSNMLVNNVADKKGSVKLLQLSHVTEKKLTVCVGYKGSHSKGWSLMPVASLEVTDAKVYPEVLIATQINRINFVVPDKKSLKGFEAAVIRGTSSSCNNIVDQTFSVQVSDKGLAFILFQFPDAAKWTVCLGMNKNKMKAVGEVTSIAPLKMTADPPIGAVGLPVSLRFTGSFLSEFKPTQFFVTDKAESCAYGTSGTVVIYGDGSMSPSTGVTNTVILRKEGSLFVCVGKKGDDNLDDHTFFVFGGILEMVKFKSMSRYVIQDSVNNLTVFPRVTDASLFLVACSTDDMCTKPVSGSVCVGNRDRHYTSLLLPLRNAAVGQYIVCQEDKNKNVVEASETLVSVLNPFVATILDDKVVQHKPFKVRLSGGDVKTRQDDITIFTMPEYVSCDETNAQREDFTFTRGLMERKITVTKISSFVKQVQLCLKASENDVFSVAKFDLLPYMTPAVIITDRKMQIRSETVQDGILAKLTAKNDCKGNVMSHGPARMKGFVSELHVLGCAGDNRLLTAVHYCESYDGGSNYEDRGLMSLIRLKECGPDSPAAIRQITVPPAKQIVEYGIDTELLTRPMLSQTSDCTSFVNARNGYLPQYDDMALFYVCVSAKEYPSYVFTTENPTLRVLNFEASPTSIYSQPNITSAASRPLELKLNYPTGTTQTYLSHSSSCSSVFATAAGLAYAPSQTSLLLNGEYGLKYICAKARGDENVKAVALVLVVNPPTAFKVDPALVPTAPFRATLQVMSDTGKNPLYSLFPDADSNFLFAHLYTYSFRGVFLSNNMCKSVLAGTEVVNVGDSGSVVLSTTTISTDLKFLSLCAGTPAGNLTVLSGIEVSSSIIFPSKFVLGADMKVYIPLSPNSVFYVKQDSDCGGLDIVPPFITNNEGYGTLTFKRSVGVGFLPEGRWMVCKQADDNSFHGLLSNNMIRRATSHILRPLVSIEAFAPVYYNIRGVDVVVGVASVVVLLDDLKAKDLLPGFSTDKNCKIIDESQGSWRTLGNSYDAESKKIVINAIEPASVIYFCAVAPINGSVVRVPFNGGLRFVPSNKFFPSTLSRCEPTKLSSCVLPGSPHSGVFVTIIKGHCCDIAHRGNVIGLMKRTSDNQCSLHMDSKKLNDYPQHTEFSVCAWDTNDYSYCTTLGTVNVGNDVCIKNENGSYFPFSNGALVAILIFTVIFGVLLIVLLTCLVVECYRKRTIMKEVSIATNSLRSGSEMNPLALYNYKNGNIVLGRGENLLHGSSGAHIVGGSQPTITFTTTTDQTVGRSTSREVSPEFLRLNLWEGIENDEREQIALLEARARYNMRLIFNDGLERIRLIEKERAVQFEISDDESNQPAIKNPEVTAINVASAPTMSVTSLIDCSPVKKAETMETSSAVCYAVPIAFERDERASIASSRDVLNYTTTQRFFDDWRFTLDSEAVRRQRILNWEDEDWNALIETEFNSYIFLQQSTLPLPPPLPSPLPLTDAVVRPFVFLSDKEVTGEIECEKGNNEVSSVPGSVSQLTRDTVSGVSVKAKEEVVCATLRSVSLEKPPTTPDMHSNLEVIENVGEVSSMGTWTSSNVSERQRKGRGEGNGASKRPQRHHADPLGPLDMTDMKGDRSVLRRGSDVINSKIYRGLF